MNATFNPSAACELNLLRATPSSNGTIRKAGEAMSFPFLGWCALAGWIALSLIGAAFSQSASAGPAMSAHYAATSERLPKRRTS